MIHLFKSFHWVATILFGPQKQLKQFDRGSFIFVTRIVTTINSHVTALYVTILGKPDLQFHKILHPFCFTLRLQLDEGVNIFLMCRQINQLYFRVCKIQNTLQSYLLATRIIILHHVEMKRKRKCHSIISNCNKVSWCWQLQGTFCPCVYLRLVTPWKLHCIKT